MQLRFGAVLEELQLQQFRWLSYSYTPPSSRRALTLEQQQRLERKTKAKEDMQAVKEANDSMKLIREEVFSSWWSGPRGRGLGLQMCQGTVLASG